MLSFVVQADDLTGALDTGVMLAKAGVFTRVGFAPDENAPVQVVDTESRHLPPKQAYQAAHAVAIAANKGGARWFYKKVDSTMRGNIKAEMQAAADGFLQPVHFCPAFPALGRTTEGGVQLLYGQRLQETALGKDSQNPVTTGDIRKILGDLVGSGALIYDAQSDADLQVLSNQLQGQRCFAGSAGWAQYLPFLASLPKGQMPKIAKHKRMLVLAGSQSQVSRAQVHAAKGFTVLTMQQAQQADAVLKTDNVIITTGDYVAGQEGGIARTLGEIAARVLGEDTLLCCFGGDTARAAMLALGIESLYPIKELQPGVPLSLGRGARELALVTKAGAFGDADLLNALYAHLT